MAREDVRAIIYYLLVAIIASIFLWVTIFVLPKTDRIVYNCTMAEISPDFPPEVREGCRKLRAEAYKRDTSR